MSDITYHAKGCICVKCDDAERRKSLLRELSTARAQLAARDETIARLRADAERLDWLCRYARYIDTHDGVGLTVTALPGEPESSLDVRTVIDAAGGKP
jgi:hypothetical protein